MLFLIKVFIAVFIPVFLFTLYARRFANPYTNNFIFGKKGSGKSTLLVKKMLKYQKRGWHIYTDMKDCIIPGVRIIDSAMQLEHFTPEYHSMIALDETGISFDNRNYKKFPEGLRDWFKFERKYKVVCWQNSQSYDIDKKVRDCVDAMFLQSNISNVIGITRPINKTVGLTQPSADSEARIAEGLKFAPIWKWEFTWLPKYHKYFDSFSAPPRLPLPFKEITMEHFNAVNELRKIKKSFRFPLRRCHKVKHSQKSE